jgi:hypothetical protein
LAAVFVLVVASGAAAQVKKAKGTSQVTGAAGVVTASRQAVVLPSAIDDHDRLGYFCAYLTPNVHYLGTIGAGTGVIVEFNRMEDSDPIAVLSTLKVMALDVGAENAASDDDGGNLNPRFELRRNYQATYVLTVGSADYEEPACYQFRVRLVP